MLRPGTPSAHSGTGTVDRLSLTLPSTWRAGDEATIVACASGTSMTATTPAGWTVVQNRVLGNFMTLYSFRKTLTAADIGGVVQVVVNEQSRLTIAGFAAAGVRSRQAVSQIVYNNNDLGVPTPQYVPDSPDQHVVTVACIRYTTGADGSTAVLPSEAGTEVLDVAGEQPSGARLGIVIATRVLRESPTIPAGTGTGASISRSIVTRFGFRPTVYLRVWNGSTLVVPEAVSHWDGTSLKTPTYTTT